MQFVRCAASLRRLSLVCCTVILAAVAGCGGKGSAQLPDSSSHGRPAQPAHPGVQPGLPALDDLLTSKAGSLVDADRYSTGSLFKPSLPNTNVQVNGTALTFMPTWNKSGAHDSTKAALAVYEFPLSGLTGAQDLTLNWTAAPADFSNLFIGLSNFGTGRWEWVQGTAAPLALPDIAPYQAADGRVFVTVMLLGLQNADLAWIRIGGNIAPTAALTAVSDTGGTPFNAQFNAGASSDLDGTIATYDWDWENDGTFDLLGGTAQESHSYSPEGDYTCAVRVTDDGGLAAIATMVVHAVPPGAGPTAVLTSDFVWHDAPFGAQLDASGSTAPNGVGKYEWDLDNNGSFETDTGLTPTATLNVPGVGDFTAALRVTDGIGLTSTANITVHGDADGYDEVENNDTTAEANLLPSVNFSGFEGNLGDAGGGYDDDLEDFYSIAVTQPVGLLIEMLFLDADADLDMKLLDTDGTTEIGSSTGTSDNEDITYTFVTPGTYFLRCYRFGTTVSSANYTLQIKQLIAPVVSLNANPSSGAAPLAVDFTATANDPDGTIANVDWDWNGDGAYDFDSGTSLATSHTYISGGTHNATVRVTDNDGATATAMIPITVTVSYDEVEPNDAFGEAQALPLADFSGFTGNIGAGGLMDGDESDWYSFAGTAGQEIGTVLAFDNSEANLKLSLYDTDGLTLIIDSEYGTSDDDEFVMFTPAATGTYFINVTCPAGASSTDYVISQLEFTLGETEPNDDPELEGDQLPALPFMNFGGMLEVHDAGSDPPTPHDYFKLDIPAPGSHTIWLRFVDNLCDVDMRLFAAPNFDHNNDYLASSTGTDSDERIVYDFPAAGTYYLKVYNYALGPANYIIQAQ